MAAVRLCGRPIRGNRQTKSSCRRSLWPDVVQIQFDTSSGSAISSNRSSISSSSASVRSSSDQTDDDSKRPGSGAVVRLALSIATALPRLTRAPFVLCCLLQPSSTAIMMQSVQDESLQAVLFHDRTISEDTNVALKQLLQQILEQFQSMHSAELSKLRPQLKSSATMTPKELEKLQSHFLPFMTELDTKLVPAFETSLLPKLMETSLVLRPMEAKMSGAQAGKSIQQQQQQEK